MLCLKLSEGIPVSLNHVLIKTPSEDWAETDLFVGDGGAELGRGVGRPGLRDHPHVDRTVTTPAVRDKQYVDIEIHYTHI